MSTNQEIEVKFFVKKLDSLEQQLRALQAHLEQERVFEVNLRFDTADGDLTREFKALRLRQDTIARLTFKGPGTFKDGIRTRQELEFTVSDFEMARAFLEALGFSVSFIYEKYRTTYGIEGMHIALDELPYGNFIEIEGPDPAAIRVLSRRLGLDWNTSVADSYAVLFDKLRLNMGLGFRNLTFQNFAGVSISESSLGVRPADQANSI
jgi:adenylate cyclase, class 2